MVYKYALQDYDKEKMARCLGLSLKGMSMKDAHQIGQHIKGKNTKLVLKELDDAINFKRAIPYTRYNSGLGHQKGKVGPGRYPIKGCEIFVKLVKSVVSNANEKNLNVDNLIIKHVCVQTGPSDYHHGRQGSRSVKQCHVEIAVCEEEQKVLDDKKIKKDSKKGKNSKTKKEDAE
ncbi:MAG: 50S ribosomal protein L22 [Candidatus Woesearchaeota archaeon]|jgi:ribosomal protein uL22